MNFCISDLKRIAITVGVVALLVFAIIGYYTTASAEYVKIVDGDSLEIGRRRVRLLEIDAPEYRQYCFDAKHRRYDCGVKATEQIKKMIKSAGYRVDCRSRKTDRYKRELAECFAGGKNLNLEMIRSGWAVTYRTENPSYINAEKEARKDKRGVWQGKFMRPEYYRRLQRR